MRSVPIRFKLLAALALPLLLLAALVYREVSQATQEVGQLRRQADLTTAITGPQGALTSLQAERDWAVVDLAGATADIQLETTGHKETRRATDEAVAELANEVSSRGGRIAAEYRPVLEAFDDLGAIRELIDVYRDREVSRFEGPHLASAVFVRYSDIVSTFFRASTQLSLEIDQPQMRRGADLVDLASRQVENVATVRHLATSGLAVQPTEALIQLADLEQDLANNLRRIEANSTGPYRQLAGESLPAELTEDISAAIDETISGAEARSADSDEADEPGAQLLDVVKGREADAYAGFRNGVAQVVDTEAGRLVGEAERTRRLYLAAASVVILLTILISRRVALSITRPLRALTTQAAEMANDRLPDAVQDILETPLGEDVVVPHMDPIQVKTRDEVADVAHALNTVQDSALELAVEQAVLRRNIADSFVNLGRRNQNLLGRQLDFITELEQNETDPDTLANLFRLDHLATRMRRNAESLLVLAGIEPPRKWAAPVRLTDVIRAALGEVEDYQRVTVRTVEPATIVGSAAADLAHLLAELIENALIFSPPDQTVEIRGRVQKPAHLANGAGTSPSNAGYMLTVADAGVGMPPAEITRANRRLAGAESFTIAPSKYLGHYVVGKLADFHALDVQLHSTPGGGITATVHLSPDLLAQADDERQPVSPVSVLNPTDQAPGQTVAATPGVNPGSLPIHG